MNLTQQPRIQPEKGIIADNDTSDLINWTKLHLNETIHVRRLHTNNTNMQTK